jgi:hypothetical protein
MFVCKLSFLIYLFSIDLCGCVAYFSPSIIDSKKFLVVTRQVTSITLAVTYLICLSFKHMRGRAISMVRPSLVRDFVEVQKEIMLTIDSFDSRTSYHRGASVLLNSELTLSL